MIAQLRKGTTELLILHTLDAKPMHGYGLKILLRETFDMKFPNSMIYRMLSSLHKRGYISPIVTDDPRGRVAFKLTPSGASYLAEQRVLWNRLISSVNTYINA